MSKKPDENAKNPDFQTPVKIKGAKPGDYDASMGAPGGTEPAMKPGFRRPK